MSASLGAQSGSRSFPICAHHLAFGSPPSLIAMLVRRHKNFVESEHGKAVGHSTHPETGHIAESDWSCAGANVRHIWAEVDFALLEERVAIVIELLRKNSESTTRARQG